MRQPQGGLFQGRSSLWLAVVVLAAHLPCLRAAAPPGADTLDGVAFTRRPDVLYGPIRELGRALNLPVHWDAGSRTI